MSVYKKISDKMTLCIVTMYKMTTRCDYGKNDSKQNE